MVRNDGLGNENSYATDVHELIMFEMMPLCCYLMDREGNPFACNQETVYMFGVNDQHDAIARFDELSPTYQPDGELSMEKKCSKVKDAYENGYARFEWMHQNLNGEPIPAEITLVRVMRGDDFIVAGYTRDLRELKEAIRMLEQLESLAFTDSLTGIFNRRHFMDRAQKTFADYTCGQKPIAVVMLDVDWFKCINDTYGHLVGDAVLREIAVRIQGTLRAGDVFARYGGEEFIILLPGVAADAAYWLAERIRMQVGAVPFTYEDEEQAVITISVGVSVKQEEEASLEEVIRRADWAMNTSKQHGRNRVTVCNDDADMKQEKMLEQA